MPLGLTVTDRIIGISHYINVSLWRVLNDDYCHPNVLISWPVHRGIANHASQSSTKYYHKSFGTNLSFNSANVVINPKLRISGNGRSGSRCIRLGLYKSNLAVPVRNQKESRPVLKMTPDWLSDGDVSYELPISIWRAYSKSCSL